MGLIQTPNTDLAAFDSGLYVLLGLKDLLLVG